MAEVETTNESKELTPMTYDGYLKVNQLLDCQCLVSTRHGKTAHDEHLFIVVHQVFELWFKQILCELDSVCELFQSLVSDDSKAFTIRIRMQRINLILKLIIEHFTIMETMTPMDFLEFRGYLSPASGFQSLQFRLIENKLGLEEKDRVPYCQQHYTAVFNDQSKQLVNKSLTEPNLLKVVENWLENTPGLLEDEFDFTARYTKAISRYLNEAYLIPAENETDQTKKTTIMAEYQTAKNNFDSILNPEKHNELVKAGHRRLSHKALQGMLMISLYRNEPRFNQPYQLLTLLMDMDSLVGKWRYHHVQMVQRMIGSKVGTGGSSGYHYLKSTVIDRYKVFVDLLNLSTFLIEQKYIPPLTPSMKELLSVFSKQHISEE
ncbi:hypothetical protein CHS0354_003586 [Potamilus streckersoni]|uniref:Tryptophan 2,3-dioxygenase n=1 Tax=Potamilus streckersoni TaxID=2493646 RepID=A0AAE0VZ78_9BIVA|nr:hypothetical protein CHS0354_003586 [Potamilus streckersoni]